MASVHLLNVKPGDCTIVRHNSGRVTVLDICDGNLDTEQVKLEKQLLERLQPRGNFAMCDAPTNPIDYLRDLGVGTVFRFILSHPDMDHMDGLDALLNSNGITNFWHAGTMKDK